MIGALDSSRVTISVVGGIPLIIAILVILWVVDRVPRAAAGTASLIGVALIALLAWQVLRPAPPASAATSTVGGGTLGSSGPSAAPVTCSPSGTSLVETVHDIKYSATCLAAPAATAFHIQFQNKDSTTHNIHIYTSDPTTHADARSLFSGALVTGPAEVTYDVPALPAGTYFFHCDVHPAQMFGTFVVAG
jgi:plastocyanin